MLNTTAPAPSTDVTVLVLEHKRMKSWPKYEVVPQHQLCPLSYALSAEWASDAHAAAYYLHGAEQGMLARLHMSALPVLREQGQDVAMRSIWVDVDNPGHTPWDSTNREVAQRGIESAWPLLQYSKAIYATTHGLRIVFALQEALSVEAWLGYEYSLMMELQRLGIGPDLTSSGQWNRLFRLPRVTREGAPTSQEPWFFIHHPTNALWSIVDHIKPNYDRVAQSSRGKRVHLGRPAPEQPHDNVSSLPLYKHLRMVFGGEPWAPAVFYDRRISAERIPDLATPGTRYSTIVSIIGAMAPRAADIERRTQDSNQSCPEQLWSILYEPIANLGPDDNGDFHQSAWKAILDFWAWEDDPSAEEEAETGTFDETQGVIVPPEDADTLLARVRKWHPNATIEWLRAHAILRFRSLCYLLNRDGRYSADPVPIAYEGVANAVRAQGLTALVPLGSLSREGQWTARPSASIMRDNVSLIRSVRFSPRYEGTYDENDKALEFPCHQIRPLVPRWDPLVHSFLWAFSGYSEEQFAHLQLLIAGMLAVKHGNMPALHMHGVSGAGKGMLVTAIAQAFTTDGSVVAGETFFSKFNENMLLTPIIHIDEKMPKLDGPASSRFRSAVSGDTIPVEPKGGQVINIRSKYRILITTNNVHAVRALFRGEQFGEDDIEALRERLQVFHVAGTGKQWMNAHGNYVVTDSWLNQRDPILARHMLYLYEQHRERFEGCRTRFLVPPNISREDIAHHIHSLESVKGATLLTLQDYLGHAELASTNEYRLVPDGPPELVDRIGQGPYLQVAEESFYSAVRQAAERANVREARSDHHIRQAVSSWGFAIVQKIGQVRIITASIPTLRRVLYAFEAR